MSVFDYVIEQLLEVLRQAIYRYAGRSAPARQGRPEIKASGRPAAASKAASKTPARRRRGSPWSSPLVWAGIVVLGVFVAQRLRKRD